MNNGINEKCVFEWNNAQTISQRMLLEGGNKTRVTDSCIIESGMSRTRLVESCNVESEVSQTRVNAMLNLD
jgi:hypothetical protein